MLKCSYFYILANKKFTKNDPIRSYRGVLIKQDTFIVLLNKDTVFVSNYYYYYY